MEECGVANYDLTSAVTPVKVEQCCQLMKETGYPEGEIEFLEDGFTKGLSIGYEGPRNRVMTSNNLRMRVGTKQARLCGRK